MGKRIGFFHGRQEEIRKSENVAVEEKGSRVFTPGHEKTGKTNKQIKHGKYSPIDQGELPNTLNVSKHSSTHHVPPLIVPQPCHNPATNWVTQGDSLTVNASPNV